MNVDDRKDVEVAETKEKKAMALGVPSWHFQSTKERKITFSTQPWSDMPPDPVFDPNM